jgi:leader peptidase (prepilin peptidase) / N-methyltransferase
VKLLAAMGAFLGWEAVLFIVAMASILGSVLGGVALLRGGQSWAGRLPFGPYLSAAAVIWVLGGSHLLAWYWHSLDQLHTAIR